MTFTYSNTSLSTDLAKIRLAIGDTADLVDRGESLTDEEIAVAQAETSSLELAAVRACEDLIAKFTRIVNRNAAGVTSSQGDKLRNLKDLLEILKKRAGKGRIQVFAGGISQDRLDDAADDDDFPQPAFSVGMDDKP